MNDEFAIKVENVSKKYCKSLKRSMVYGVCDIGKNILGLSSYSERLRNDEFWAVNNVSFELKKGETLGIIGPNGSGKTSLLKMLNGIFWPDKGKITIKGRVGALIEVGAGFHPLLTGRENIYINAAILGMAKEEVDRKFDSIVEFAAIGDFLDVPVKHYSSGMFVRLGFAVAIHCDLEILLIDEVLAVGDLEFRLKCLRKMSHFVENKEKTIIFVSHSMWAVEALCRKVLWLNYGEVKEIGESSKVISDYYKNCKNEGGISTTYNKEQLKERTNTHLQIGENITGTLVKIRNLYTADDTFLRREKFIQGENINVHVSYEVLGIIEKPNFILTISYRDIEICKISSYSISPLEELNPGDGQICFRLKDLNLYPGLYAIDIGARNYDMPIKVWDAIWKVHYFEITGNVSSQGLTISERYIFNPIVEIFNT